MPTAGFFLIACLVFISSTYPVFAGQFEDAMAAYERGDYETTYRLVQPLAEQGHAEAQCTLGLMYEMGRGVKRDSTESVKWYQKAAKQGYPEAQRTLGVLYEEGHGVPKDYADAMRWYRKAAEQGDGRASCYLGMMYRDGTGVPPDAAEATKWYKKAVEQGDASCQQFLDGLERRNEYAKKIRESAEQGGCNARIYLGDCYEKGIGVPQDFVLAYTWYILAASTCVGFHDSQNVARKKDSLAAKMTSVQIAEAQRLAREWKPKMER